MYKKGVHFSMKIFTTGKIPIVSYSWKDNEGV